MAEALTTHARNRAAKRVAHKSIRLAPRVNGVHLKVPFYAQTLEFTCGPACVMMALKYFHPEIALNRGLELILWREATLVFMTRGLGGCGPLGLAAAAARRGLRALVVQSQPVIPFLYSVRTPQKRDVLRLVHEQNLLEADRLGVTRRYGRFDVALVRTLLERGVVPIVLISLYRLYGTKEPHWVVVTGCDDDEVYFHDPYAPLSDRRRRPSTGPQRRLALGANRKGSIGVGDSIPVSVSEFRSMRSYGKDLTRMVVALSDRPIDVPADVVPSERSARTRPAPMRVIG